MPANAVLLLTPEYDAQSGYLLLYIGGPTNGLFSAQLNYNDNDATKQSTLNTTLEAAGYPAGDITIATGAGGTDGTFTVEFGWTLTFSGTILGGVYVPPILPIDTTAGSLEGGLASVVYNAATQAGQQATMTFTFVPNAGGSNTLPAGGAYNIDGSTGNVASSGPGAMTSWIGTGNNPAAGTLTIVYNFGAGSGVSALQPQSGGAAGYYDFSGLTLSDGVTPWDGTVEVSFTDGVDQQDTIVVTGNSGAFAISTNEGTTASIAMPAASGDLTAALTAIFGANMTVSVSLTSAGNVYTYTLDFQIGISQGEQCNPSGWGASANAPVPITVAETVQTPGGSSGGGNIFQSPIFGDIEAAR